MPASGHTCVTAGSGAVPPEGRSGYCGLSGPLCEQGVRPGSARVIRCCSADGVSGTGAAQELIEGFGEVRPVLVVGPYDEG